MVQRPQKIPKIGKKIIIAMLVVSLVPLGFIGIHNIDYTHNQLSLTKEEELKTIAIDLATYANSLLSNAQKRIEELAKNPLTIRTATNASEWNESLLWNSYEGGIWDLEQNITQEKIISEWNAANDLDPGYSNFINDLAKSNGFSEIFVTDSRGLVYASSQSIPGDFYQKGEFWWNSTRHSSMGIFIDFGYDESTKQFLMDVTVEISSENEFMGMIKAGFDVTNLSNDLERSIVTDTITAFTINTEWNIFTHPNITLVGRNATEFLLNSYSSNFEFSLFILSNMSQSGNTILWINENDHYCGYSHLENWDIFLFAVEDAGVVELAIFDQLIVFLSILLLVVISVVIVTFVLSTSLIRPVTRLTDVSKKVADGDFSVQISQAERARKDEFGDLSVAFFLMIERLQKSFTELMTSKNEISEAKEEYQALVENLEEGILLEDENEIITFVNPRTSEMLGYTEEELIGKQTKIVIAHEELKKIKKETRKRVKGESSRYESLLLSKGKQSVPVIISANPIFSMEGVFQGVLSVITDITEQKKLQLLKDRFIATTNHELRTPVTVLKGLIEFLSKDYELTDSMKKEILSSLDRNVNRLIRLVNTVHDISQISNQQFSISQGSIQLDDFVENLREQLIILYPKRRITVNQISESNKGEIIFDHDRILQAIHNLISNAVKNSPVESQNEISIFDRKEDLLIIVQDYGAGISWSNILKLFQPFSHIDTPYSSSGSGLGLYVVKNIVLAHGGEIEVFSREDVGTTIAMRIPLQNSTDKE